MVAILRDRPSHSTHRHLLSVVLAVVASAACGETTDGHHLAATSSDQPSVVAAPPIYVEARTPSLPTYPCSRCHADRAPDPTQRPLHEFHTARADLAHGGGSGWCYRCHTKDDIDKLHLADGTLVPFDQAYELCGSCHGDKLRQWKDGIHGLTTGYWNGEKFKRSCTACHNPHRPKFGSMTPERPPGRPRPFPKILPAPRGSHE